jgi:hypothetical protein
VFKTTIDSVLQDLNKKIVQLRSLSDNHLTSAGKHRELQTKHGALAEFYVEEKERAARIAKNF